ncbi:hypothetical protein GIB67_036371 [Kingdonia uniflora]|uniref:Uncharacterized protein n=1 Tax=Kingdonia uniflora TaxID=39325 RepID=A0A7J7L452_9MAGN|nr:hypothetical protein GIB67_036371 [Kingdonia uniflora]
MKITSAMTLEELGRKWGDIFLDKWMSDGKIMLPTLDPLSTELQELYDGNGILSRSFRNYLRDYNAANAFTSLGVHMDDRIV